MKELSAIKVPCARLAALLRKAHDVLRVGPGACPPTIGLRVRVCACVCVRVCVCARGCVCVYTYEYMFIHICICIYVCVEWEVWLERLVHAVRVCV